MNSILRRSVAGMILVFLAWSAWAAASDLGAANEVAARVGGRVLDVRRHAALIDARAAERDAPEVRAALDGATLLEPVGGDAQSPFVMGVLTPDERLVIVSIEGADVRWSSTTLADNLRLLPGFRNGEGPFPPDFDATDTAVNRERYGGAPPVDDQDYALRCTASADSNGSTLTCANGYGRQIYESRCFRDLSNAVACDVDEP